MIKIMIADDHAMVREGLKNLIEFDGMMKVVAESNNGMDCIEKVFDIQPDILLLDVNMPEKDGLQVLKEIRKKNNKLNIIMLTVHNECDYLINAIENGVNGYLLKDSPSSELINAIMTVNDGEQYIQPDLIPSLNATLITRDTDLIKIKLLTKRELEVLQMVASGSFNKDIAINLNISERTVKNHISNIFKKIEVEDRTQAAVFAIKNNIIKLH